MIQVMMVDDDTAMLDLTKIFLERFGDIRVDGIQSAQEALEKIRENGHYDVIVSDYSMPVMDGISFLKQVRGRNSEIPFIIFTGRGREEIVIEALNNGADYYLQKDAHPEVLYAELGHQIHLAVERTRAKRAIAESEGKYRTLFTNMNEGFSLCELVRDAQNRPIDFVVKEVNSQVKLMMGLDPQDVIGKRATEISLSEAPPSLHIFADVVETGSPARFESYLASVDRYFRISAFPAGDGQFATIFSDITDHKRMDEELRGAHEELRGAHKRLQDIIEFLPDATVVVDCDRRVVSWNRAIEEMTGISREKIMREGVRLRGETLYGLEKPLMIDEIFSEDVRLEDHYDFVIRKRNSIYGESFIPSLYGGEGAYICVVASPLFDEEGQMVGAIETIRDITERREALLDLYEARDYMESLLHYANAPMVVWSPDLKIVRFNRAFERLTGYRAEEIIGENAAVLFSGGGIELLERTNYARKGEGWEPVEIPIRCRDGDERIVLWNSANVRSEKDGTLVATIIQGQDITERKRTEERLIQAHNQLLEIIDFLPDPTFVIDQERTVIAWNRAIEEMTGIAKEDIVGKGDYAYGEAFYGVKRPILIDLIFSRDEELESLYSYVKREGDTLFAEAFVSPPRGGKGVYVWGTASPLFDKDDNIVGAIESIRDVTEIVETEMALQENEERMKLVIEGANLGIWDRNVATGEVVRNRRLVEIFGYSEDELVGQVWERERMIHPDDFGKVMAALQDHFDGKTQKYEIDYRLKRKDGRWIWVHDRGEVMTRDDAGSPLRMAGITQEITEIRQYQEALKEANKKLNLLSSVTRHDIQNQITGLSGYALLLSEILPEDPTMRRYIDRIMELTETIHRHVAFTRDYQNMGVKAPEWQKVEEVVQRAAQSAPAEVAKGQIDLEIYTGPLEIFADPMLERVFSNLLENAARHGGRVSKIRVAFVKKGDEDQGTIVVEDDGSGIPEEMKARIFDQAFGRHTGYGLFLSREILGITGMTIGEEGEGARFEITVPREKYRRL